jgi:hypothetical protein
MAARLRVPEPFGQHLRTALVPGSTVLVTDLPGMGGNPRQPYAALLQSEPATPTQK